LRFRIAADGGIDPDAVFIIGDEPHPWLAGAARDTLRLTSLRPPPLADMEVVVPLDFRIQ